MPPRGNLSDISLADFEGEVEILNLVPNLDTGVGAASARRLEKEAGDLGRRTTPPPGGLDRAFYWQRLIDEGIVKSGSEIARREG